MAANSKLIIFLTPCDSASFTQKLPVDHTATTKSETIRHTSQSCCFTSPTKFTNCVGISLGCNDGGNNCSSKANHGNQVLDSLAFA